MRLSDLMFWKKKEVPKTSWVKRNFDNVPWKWVEGEGMRAHRCFIFTNGLGVIVFKDSPYTFDGMEVKAIQEFNPDGSFKLLQIPEIPFYNTHGGVGVEDVERMKNKVRSLRRFVTPSEKK